MSKLYTTLEFRRHVNTRAYSKGERIRLIDGLAGCEAYHSALVNGEASFMLGDVEIPLSAVKEVYHGPSAEASRQPGPADLVLA